MFKRIVVPIDVDEPEIASAVFSRALELAEQNRAEMQLVSVLPGFGMPIVASYITDALRQETVRRMQEALEAFISEHSPVPVPYTIATGKDWEQIVRTAESWGADLIVVYQDRERELQEVFSGSCAKRVAEHAPCSVLWLRHLVPETGGAA